MPKDNFGKKKRKRKQTTRAGHATPDATRLNQKKLREYNEQDKEAHRRYVMEKPLTAFQLDLLDEDMMENLWKLHPNDDQLHISIRFVSNKIKFIQNISVLSHCISKYYIILNYFEFFVETRKDMLVKKSVLFVHARFYKVIKQNKVTLRKRVENYTLFIGEIFTTSILKLLWKKMTIVGHFFSADWQDIRKGRT